jgi:hypothetical protein
MQNENSAEPDWDTPLNLSVTPALLIHALFGSATTVHTGWSSCVDDGLALADLVSVDEGTGNYCRLVEQEYMEEDNEEVLWHDWAVELRLGNVLITGHWQIQVSTSPMDWDWCAREAENAFEKACVLFGRRIRRGVGVEDPSPQSGPVKQQRH